MVGLTPFLFKGKRIPPTKTRPLRQGSKRALLDEDLQAAEKTSSEPAPDESKGPRPGRGGASLLRGSDVAPLPHLGTEG